MDRTAKCQFRRNIRRRPVLGVAGLQQNVNNKCILQPDEESILSENEGYGNRKPKKREKGGKGNLISFLIKIRQGNEAMGNALEIPYIAPTAIPR